MTTANSAGAFEVPAIEPAWIASPDGWWWITEAGGPKFQVAETATFFFARSGSWLRDRLKKGWFADENGNPPDIERSPGGESAFRRFTLSDIEHMLWAYYRRRATAEAEQYLGHQIGGVKGEARMERYQSEMADMTYKLRIGIDLVKWLGRLHGIVPPPSVFLAGALSDAITEIRRLQMMVGEGG